MPEINLDIAGRRWRVELGITGEERVYIDDALVSRKNNLFNPRSRHDFEYAGGVKGTVELYMSIMDSFVRVRCSVNGEVRQEAFVTIPSPGSLRQVLVFAPLLLLMIFAAVGLNDLLNLPAPRGLPALAEFVIILWLCVRLTDRIVVSWQKRIYGGEAQKMEGSRPFSPDQPE